jgi:drug/metabolite transporter (DMT)-like permease
VRIPPEIAYALVSLTCLGVSDFLYRWGHRWGLKGAPFMLLQNLAYIPTAVAMAVFRDELEFSTALGYGFLNGLLAFCAFLLLLYALRLGEAVALVPIVRLNFVVTSLLTIYFVGESLNAAKAFAIGLAVCAIIAGGTRVAAAARRRQGLAMAVGAMLCFGFIGLFYKLGLRAGATPTAMVVAQSLGTFALALPFAMWRRDRLPRRGVPLWLPLVCGVLLSASYVALSIAFTYGEAVVVAPIAQLSFVLTGVLAVVLLKEHLTSRKIIAVLCASLAVLVFSQSQ